MKHILFFFLLLILYYNTAFSSNLKVVATIKPIHSLVSSVVDGILKPDLLSYKVASVHDYTLKPSDISRLELSNIIFYVDDGLETFVKAFAKGRKLIQLSHVVTLLPMRPHSFSRKITNIQDEKDLHIWLNPENAKLIILFISTILSKIDKENSSEYSYNAMKAIRKIDKEIKRIKEELNDFKNQKYIVTHDAYQYFEKYFSLSNPSAILAIEEDSYIGMKSLMKLKKIIREENIKCIFSHSREESIDPKTFSNDMKMVVLDPIGSEIELGNNAYLTIIDSIAQNFKSCFTDKLA